MEICTNSFMGGINQDTNVNKYSNTTYFDAQNMRLLSKESLSNGVLTNVNGVLEKITFSGGDVLLGHCVIRNIVIFFCNSNAGGKIYKWIDTNSDFPESPELIYINSNLIFNNSFPIKCIGNYENENIQKVYFTDSNTFFKHVNIAENISGISPDAMDIVSDINYFNLTLQVESGGNLKAGKIEYAYQLYNIHGSESSISPTSKLIHLTEFGESVPSSKDYRGSEVGTIVNKSVILTGTNIDSSFRRARLYAIEYTVLDQIPKVRIIGETDINGGTLYFKDVGQSIGELTLEEFRFIQNNFFPQTLDTKTNYLYAANIKEDYFDIPINLFDARAYRMNSTGECRIVHKGSVINIDTNTWEVSETSDAYNRFNDWYLEYGNNNDIATITSFEYKYDKSGIIGGEGKNISYKFTTTKVLINSEGISNIWQEDLPVNSIGVSQTFQNHVNPLTEIGYKRDEVYRFAIVFFDTKGRQSFAKWIADIRMPSNGEFPYIEYDPNLPNNVYGNILGIEFTVTIPIEIENIISGYQIVRANRTNSDKTILSQGIVSNMIDGGFKENNEDENHLYSLATVPSVYDNIYKQVGFNRVTYDHLNVSYLWTKNITSTSSVLNEKYLEFVSPEIVFNKQVYSTSNAYIEVEGYLDELSFTAIAGPTDNNSTITVSDKYKNYTYTPDYKRKQGINEFKIFSPSLRGNVSGNENHNSNNYVIDDKILNNQCTTNTPSDTRWGLRGTYAFIKPATSNPNWGISIGNTAWTGLNANTPRIFVANYKVNSAESIYGGVSYESRTNTKYYAASQFIDKDTSVIDVYGGDTYINYMFYLRSMWDTERETKAGESNDIIESVLLVPFESTINIDLRLDNPQKYMQWGFYRGEDWYPDYKLVETQQMGISMFAQNYPPVGDLYRYNTVYSTTTRSKEYIPEPYDFQYTNNYDTRITVSEKKFNGEYTDSWLKFKFNNVLDLESADGPIYRILTFGNNLYSFQEESVAVVSSNERTLIQDNNTMALALGTGGILARYDYIVKGSGVSTHDAVLGTDSVIYYVDSVRKRIYRLTKSEEPLSIVKGIDSLLNTYSFNSVVLGFDKKYNEVLFTIDNTTLVFNEFINAFVSKYTVVPTGYITVGNNLFSYSGVTQEVPWLVNNLENVLYTDDEDDYILISDNSASMILYKHNVGDKGSFPVDNDLEVFDSYVQLIINPTGNKINTYDNLDLRTDVTTEQGVDVMKETIYKIDISNSYQSYTRNLNNSHAFATIPSNYTSGITESTGAIKRIGRVWRTPLVPNLEAGTNYKRMIDSYVNVKLYYNNNTDNHFKLYDIITYLRPSNH